MSSYRYDYAGRCWWCGQTADSGEHKYKKTDLVRAFGTGPWKGDNAVVRIVEGTSRDLQSPGAGDLKFSKVLCSICNSTRSQKFDRAYHQFSDYVMGEQEEVLGSGGFKWSRIFGRDWRNGRNLVTAYWLKHIGCRFAEGGVKVDAEILRFLDNPSRIQKVPLRMELRIQEDLEALGRHLQSHNENLNSLWMGDLMCLYSKSRRMIHQATSHWGIGWLRLAYQWNLDYHRADVNFWHDETRLVRFSNVDPQQMINDCHLCESGPDSGGPPSVPR